jgi:DNA-directed RNA polymerase subunit RPC12/RpoP
MFLRIECPGCKAILQVEEALAGKQGKCIHCGHRIIVPNQSGVAISAQPLPTSPPPPPVAPPPPPVAAIPASPLPVQFLTEASPESMVRELFDRKKSALLLVFEPGEDDSYDLADVPDNKLKCIATEDINQARFAALVESFGKRFAPRKPAQRAPGSASGDFGQSGIGLGGGGGDQLFELKGDRLGMSLEDFKKRYARFTNDGRQDLPICSDQGWGGGRTDLHSEAWHRQAGIVHGRIDNPSEDNSPTIAGLKTDLLLYHFVDGLLYRISAFFATDQFHVVSDAVMKKYGPPHREVKQPRELIWENAVAWVDLLRGSVHPRTPSTLNLVHKQLLALAESRAPKGASDI